MTHSDSTKKTEPELAEYQWGDFLNSAPPGSMARILDLAEIKLDGAGAIIRTPDLVLHCSSDVCSGDRIFATTSEPNPNVGQMTLIFLSYSCRNCDKTQKTYALFVHIIRYDRSDGMAVKIGEWPPFGPPLPSRVISLVGPDRDLFLKGRRAENQALGIGAYAYYRRVVENQRGHLLGEIIRVAKRIGAKPDTITTLESAAAEQQFSKSIDLTKNAIPESLLIDGHNPLLLLHRALSVGLHDLTDEECLERARSIRLVLTELAERISQLLKDTAELKQAISHLLGEQRQ